MAIYAAKNIDYSLILDYSLICSLSRHDLIKNFGFSEDNAIMIKERASSNITTTKQLSYKGY